MKKSMTHKRAWAENPKTRGTFVSQFSKQIIPLLKKAKAKTVLDVACGNCIGITIPMLKAGFDISAFDHHQEAIKACRENAKDAGYKISLMRASMYGKFPYKSNSFDAVTCIQAIYHGRLKNIKTAIKEMQRVAKKGGLCVWTILRSDNVVFDKKEKYPYLKVQLQNKKVIKSFLRQDKKEKHLFYNRDKEYEYNVPHYYFPEKELRELLGKYFTDIKIRKVALKRDKYAKFWFVSAKAK